MMEFEKKKMTLKDQQDLQEAVKEETISAMDAEKKELEEKHNREMVRKETER